MAKKTTATKPSEAEVPSAGPAGDNNDDTFVATEGERVAKSDIPEWITGRPRTETAAETP